MGFIDDLLFPGSNKKVIGKIKFQEVRRRLASKGMSELHRNRLESIFIGDLYEQNTQKGIDKKEFEERIKWMRENKNKHGLNDKEIDLAEEIMGTML